jgi:cell division septation protein DedD
MGIAALPASADVKAGVEAWNRGDYSHAVAEWRGPALAGDADAEYNMGQAYKLGRGVPPDLAQAEIWYQKAAAQGHTMAQDNYGLALFQDGRKADALPWLEKSAARDEKRTELVLGTMLFNGDAVPKDWVRAYALVSRSSQQGLPQASQTLAQMDGYLAPEQRQQGTALAGHIADQGRSAQMAALAGPTPAPARDGAGLRGVPADRPAPKPGVVATTDLPPSTAPARHPASAPASEEARAPHPEPVRSVAVRQRPAPVPPRAPHPAAQAPHPVPAHPQPTAVAGHWKVQLGAFRDEGNARALWTRVGSRVGGHPSFARAGAVTRLQAGPFASRADAERACHAAGSGCVVLP